MKHRASYIINPVFILCLTLLLVNDFYFKAAFSNALTGKLSDFSGLVVFYGVLSFLFGLHKSFIGGVVLAFVYWKSGYSQPLIDFVNQTIPWQIARVVDYSDLLALMVLPLYHRYLQRNSVSSKINVFIPVVLPLAVFGITATSIPIDPITEALYEKHTALYEYEDSKISYTIDIPLSTIIRKFEKADYYVGSRYPSKPWEGNVFGFYPSDRCMKSSLFVEGGIRNTHFNNAWINLKTVDKGTEVKLFSLTLCHESKALSKEDAVSVFEEKFSYIVDMIRTDRNSSESRVDVK